MSGIVSLSKPENDCSRLDSIEISELDGVVSIMQITNLHGQDSMN